MKGYVNVKAKYILLETKMWEVETELAEAWRRCEGCGDGFPRL